MISEPEPKEETQLDQQYEKEKFINDKERMRVKTSLKVTRLGKHTF